MKIHRTISILCLISGIAAPIVFWATIFICAKTMGSYSHTTRMVSELGELGTITQGMFTSGLVICAALSLVLILTLFCFGKRYGISAWPIIFMLTFPVSIFCAGIFPYPTALHGILGSPSIFLPLSPLLSVLLWPSKAHLRGITPFGIVALLFMVSGFSTFFPDFFPGAVGLKQRAFHLGWSVWFIYLGIVFYTKASATIVSSYSQHA